ncbi:endonuclease/exonuclease/phosphatase family protein [Cellulomonas sp.]|uniref:endonuclease/exonuclease/phosphatase family protein n=1 Tax=Cellulomonas sp. TaxID=40001 RepID=UPI003BA98E21
MSARRPRRERLSWLLVLLLALVASLAAQPPAQAATLRTKVFDFNACDQYGRNAECDATAAQRAAAIATSVVSGASNVVTLQEVCRYTYDQLLLRLGSAWRGTFFQTVSIGDNRCAPGARSWGIALLARAPQPTNVTATLLPNPLAESERRYLLCGDVVIGAVFRVCSSHFSVKTVASTEQATTVGSQLATHAGSGGAAVLGVDTNVDVRSCPAAAALRPLYSSAFGGTSSTTCQTGTGAMVEADQYRPGGDGTYNAPTCGPSKCDYVFFTAGRWRQNYRGVVSSSWLSDHEILRGEGTLNW